jgi:hypothetical protein
MPKTTQEIYDELLRKNRPESAVRNGEGLTPNRETPVYKLPSGAGTIGATTMPKTAQQQANDLLGQINNRPEFSYDPNTDPLWQAMVNQYVHQGQRAMKDTMGQAAGLTGGYGSSYAQAAGQQQYDEYLTRLNGELGTVYDRARAAYDAEGQDLYNRYNLALGAAQDAYNRDRDALADQRYAREYADDQAYREWQMQQAELDRQDSKDKAAQSQAYEMAMTMISTGQTPPAELLSAAGISPEFASSMSSYYARMAAAQQSGGGSSGRSSGGRSGGRSGGGSGGRGGGNNQGADAQAQDAYQKALQALAYSGQTGNINYAIDALNQYADLLTPEMAQDIADRLDRLRANIARHNGKNNEGGRKDRGPVSGGGGVNVNELW